MRIGARTFDAPRVDTLVLPRDDGDVVFQAMVILERSDFDKINPAPQPPQRLRKGETVSTPLLDDPEYKLAIVQHNNDYVNWLVLKSLQATDGLEWSTVDMNDKTTWGNYVEELKAASFNLVEIAKIKDLAIGVNSLSSEKLKEAKDRFLASTQLATS